MNLDRPTLRRLWKIATDLPETVADPLGEQLLAEVLDGEAQTESENVVMVLQGLLQDIGDFIDTVEAFEGDCVLCQLPKVAYIAREAESESVCVCSGVSADALVGVKCPECTDRCGAVRRCNRCHLPLCASCEDDHYYYECKSTDHADADPF